MSQDNNYQCRGCIVLGNYCGACPLCRERIGAMYEGLLRIAARADDASGQDVRCYVADALGMTTAELELTLEKS